MSSFKSDIAEFRWTAIQKSSAFPHKLAVKAIRDGLSKDEAIELVIILGKMHEELSTMIAELGTLQLENKKLKEENKFLTGLVSND